LQKAGRELHVNRIVTGRFLETGEQMQVTVEVIDVEGNRPLWREIFDVPANNMIALEAQIAAKTRRGLAPVLGVTEFVTDNPPKPTNEEAYKLFLAAKALSTDPEPTKQAIQRPPIPPSLPFEIDRNSPSVVPLQSRAKTTSFRSVNVRRRTRHDSVVPLLFAIKI
jgi:hypothetical protein